MRVTRSLLLMSLCACAVQPMHGGHGPIVTVPIALPINSDTPIQQSQHITALSLSEPGWVFIVQSGVMICAVQEKAGGAAFPRTISIAGLPYDTSPSIDVIALPPSTVGAQRLDTGCYASHTPDCAVCIACSKGDGMGCCVKPSDGVPPTLPKPCSF